MEMPPVCPECGERPVTRADFLCGWCRANRDGKKFPSARVHCVQIEQYDENEAPANRILDIARVGDVVFFDLLEVDEKTFSRDARLHACSGHTIDTLVKALNALGWKITLEEE